MEKLTDKQKLRKQMLKKRNDILESYRANASLKICNKIADLFLTAQSFLIYCPTGSEVNIMPVFQRLIDSGKDVYFPKVEGENLLAGIVSDIKELKTGYHGIYEPETACKANCIDVALVPGVAYDTGFFRLGYGKGFYDRFFATTAVKLKAGIAFEEQLVDTVFPEKHDVAVDMLITENKLYR